MREISRLTPKATQVILAGIAALILSVGLSRFAYTPMLPLMLAETELSKAQGSFLATFNYLGYLTGALTVAWLSNNNTKLRLYRVALLLSVLSTFGMGLTTDFSYWAFLRFAGGFASIAGLLLASAFVLNYLTRSGFKPQLGGHFIGMGAGILLSGLVCSLYAENLRWDQLWWVFAALSLLLLFPAWCWLPAPQPLSGNRNNHSPERGQWLRTMLMVYFCAGFAFATGTTFILLELENIRSLQNLGAWIWVGVGLVTTPAPFIWDALARRFGLENALLQALVLQIIAMLLPLYNQSALSGVLGALLFGITFIGIVSLMLTLAGRRYQHNAAAAMGKLTLSYGLAQIIAPWLAGVAVQYSGNFQLMLQLSALLLGIAVVLMWRLQPQRPQQQL
ncbi:YbfB/YjiJ family MFS transporter [Rheinheimera sp. 4Y26]|uniref:YbfB/YjiJ family MFS transporter n=1 Tax=Rheinheimera sp. 4Y26 TaxID=2977811 RepID=UPI0021B0AE8C|nr:YbfB/YjiJ family MFS transporter [Rheinheimera sp. 4Y26]MCT6699426.1 YbfB/YjiJ family MFS transporter [Rheinheimera sp. 4Y26]